MLVRLFFPWPTVHEFLLRRNVFFWIIAQPSFKNKMVHALVDEIAKGMSHQQDGTSEWEFLVIGAGPVNQVLSLSLSVSL